MENTVFFACFVRLRHNSMAHVFERLDISRVGRWMAGWMDGNGWMDGGMGERLKGWMDG